MPELHFQVQWPDGRRVRYYSPSSAVREHLQAGVSYTLEEFRERSQAAMLQASERVRQKRGFSCSLALGTLRQLEATAALFAEHADARVKVLHFEEPAKRFLNRESD
jgi:uncharacterized repeat protein (TIGR04042 family)